MNHLGTIVALAMGALAGCAVPTLPPVIEAGAPLRADPPPTAIDDWVSACTITLGGARMISEGIIEAYQARDIIKLVCLDDKQKQVDGLLRVMENHLRRVECTTDEGQLLHELVVLQVACGKVETLRSEAGACIGEELFFVADR